MQKEIKIKIKETKLAPCASVPSLLSQSCLLQAAPAGLGLRRTLPGQNCISAHCTGSRTGCCPAGWRSVSRPAEVHKPLTPEDRDKQPGSSHFLK